MLLSALKISVILVAVLLRTPTAQAQFEGPGGGGNLGEVLNIPLLISTNSTRLNVSWVYPEAMESGTSFFHLFVQYLGPCPIEDISVLQINDTSIRSASFDGLNEFSQYDVIFSSFASSGTDLIGYGDANTTTLSSVPMPPENLVPLFITTNGITIGWDPIPCLDQNSVIFKYGAKVGTTEDLASVFATSNSKSGSFEFNIRGLTQSTSYFFRVFAVTFGGELSPFSMILEVRTNDAPVPCLSGTDSVRLRGNTSMEGYVEVCHNGSWGTVCDDSWDILDAIVVCNELLFSKFGAVSYRVSSLESEEGDTIRGNISCPGNVLVNSLLMCPHSTSCSSYRIAAVMCKFSLRCNSTDVRLVGGQTELEGRLEICVEGEWATVCDDGWGIMDSRVVCRQLGFGTNLTGITTYKCSPFGTGTELQLIGLDDVACAGTETRLAECTAITSTIRNMSHNCNHFEDIGVVCPDGTGNNSVCSENDVRLVNSASSGIGSSNTIRGQLEICREGRWRPVCGAQWDDEDAGVACRQLGFSASANIFQGAGTVSNGLDPSVLYNCSGSETALNFCPISAGMCSNNDIAGVVCSPDFTPCVNESVRLVGRVSPLEGRVEVCFQNQWGTVCDDFWDQQDAAVVCRQLGFFPEGALAVKCADLGEGVGFIFLDDVECMGNESTLLSCASNPPLQHNCNHFEDAGVRCRPDPCTEFNCLNEGTCTALNNSSPLCMCQDGFSGPSCEIDHCILQSCRNGGTCLVLSGTMVSCLCPFGYGGEECEQDISFCGSSSCSGNGNCLEGPGALTSCNCNPDFIGTACSLVIDTVPGPCLFDVVMAWNLTYMETPAGEIVNYPCSMIYNTIEISGETSRLCLGNDVWRDVDVSLCQQESFQNITIMAAQIFNREVIVPSEVDNVLEQLVVATSPESTSGLSQFPRDLETTNAILDMSVDFFTEDLTSSNPLPLNIQIVDIINNILEDTNTEGWNSFSETETGSEAILNNAERYGNYFINALMNENINASDEIRNTMTIVKKNIIIQAEVVDPNNVNAILFPSDINLDTVSEFGSAQSILSREFLIDRGAEDVTISAVNILLNNIEQFLPVNDSESKLQPVTSVISTQVVVPSDDGAAPTISTGNTDAQFRFTTKEFGDDKVINGDPICVFWDEKENMAESAWSSVDIVTEITNKDTNKKTFNVICRSTHLTSFAVLLSVNNAISGIEEAVLTYVTYIGCSISIFFLLVSITYFVVFVRGELFTSVHYFIHLNLSIALLLGYVVFLAGVDTAVVNRIGCAFVAGLLHYLFTAVFFWMLCEGIMIYLMLVVVFSTISKKWWLFFLLGWVPPLIIVGISAAIIHREYGTDEYCWISTENPKTGAIWAFAVPMLVIIIINCVILAAALRSLYKVTRDKLDKGSKDSGNTRTLFKTLFTASLVLLPLLGLTWVFGLLSVSRYTTFFAWIFTILNSLQGLFIFIFHVLRSEKVWGKLCGKKGGKSSANRRSTNSTTADYQKQHGRSSQTSMGSLNSQFSSNKRVPSQITSSSSFMKSEVIKEEVEEIVEQSEIDTDQLIDVNLSMFSREDGSDKVESDDQRSPEKNSDDEKFGYTMTVNWQNVK